jgi:hypothetical protein
LISLIPNLWTGTLKKPLDKAGSLWSHTNRKTFTELARNWIRDSGVRPSEPPGGPVYSVLAKSKPLRTGRRCSRAFSEAPDPANARTRLSRCDGFGRFGSLTSRLVHHPVAGTLNLRADVCRLRCRSGRKSKFTRFLGRLRCSCPAADQTIRLFRSPQ